MKLLVDKMVAAIKPPYVLNCQVGSFPSCWEPQQTNTQLFEVDVVSSEVAELVETLRHQQPQLEIVKVIDHCIRQSNICGLQSWLLLMRTKQVDSPVLHACQHKLSTAAMFACVGWIVTVSAEHNSLSSESE